MKLSNVAKIGVVALGVAVASTAFAGKGNTKTEAFKVKIGLIAAITIVEDAAMDFGEYVAGDEAGAKVLGHASGAKFTISGETGRSVTVSLANSSVTMLRAGGVSGTANDEIVANAFEIWNQGGLQIGLTEAGGQTTLTAGSASVEVGATATVDAGDVAGAYEGENTLQVVYF